MPADRESRLLPVVRSPWSVVRGGAAKRSGALPVLPRITVPRRPTLPSHSVRPLPLKGRGNPDLASGWGGLVPRPVIAGPAAGQRSLAEPSLIAACRKSFAVALRIAISLIAVEDLR